MRTSEVLEEFFGKSEEEKAEEYFSSILYYFFKKGVDYNSFIQLPLPYIFDMLREANKEAKEKKKEADKLKRKR